MVNLSSKHLVGVKFFWGLISLATCSCTPNLDIRKETKPQAAGCQLVKLWVNEAEFSPTKEQIDVRSGKAKVVLHIRCEAKPKSVKFTQLIAEEDRLVKHQTGFLDEQSIVYSENLAKIHFEIDLPAKPELTRLRLSTQDIGILADLLFSTQSN